MWQLGYLTREAFPEPAVKPRGTAPPTASLPYPQPALPAASPADSEPPQAVPPQALLRSQHTRVSCAIRTLTRYIQYSSSSDSSSHQHSVQLPCRVWMGIRDTPHTVNQCNPILPADKQLKCGSSIRRALWQMLHSMSAVCLESPQGSMSQVPELDHFTPLLVSHYCEGTVSTLPRKCPSPNSSLLWTLPVIILCPLALSAVMPLLSFTQELCS